MRWSGHPALPWTPLLVSLLAWLPACTTPRANQEASPRGAGDAQPRAGAGAARIEVLSIDDAAPEGSDRAPRYALALVRDDGTRAPIAEPALSYAPFRSGVALVDVHKRLWLISKEGARSLLAQHAGAPPAQGPDGELVYVARHGEVAEVHVLRVEGENRIVASGLGNAGGLAPQPDGRVLFVGARNGGVAGVWTADRAGARCITNCELRTGTDWGDAYVPPPRDEAELQLQAERGAPVRAAGDALAAPAVREGATRAPRP